MSTNNTSTHNTSTKPSTHNNNAHSTPNSRLGNHAQTGTNNFPINNTVKDPHYVKNKKMYSPLKKDDHIVLRFLEQTKADVHESFCDNFNTFRTLTAVLNLVTLMHQKMYNVQGQVVAVVLGYVKRVIGTLGLMEARESGGETLVPNIICKFRNEVRMMAKEKRGWKEVFAACDGVRDEMLEAGYVIEDKGGESSIRKAI